MIHVEEINDPGELSGYRATWDTLLSQTPNATFFQSLAWLDVFWRHFGQGQRLRVLVVHDDDGPVGILPLVRRTETTGVGTVRVLTYPLHDWGTFYGPLGADSAAVLTAGLRHVHHTPRDWDLLDLRWVDVDGGDFGRTEAAMQSAGFYPHKQAWAQAAVVDIEGTWLEYWRGRTKKWRHNVERLARRLAEQGEVRLLRYRPLGAARGEGDPRWDLYDTCVRIAAESWQGSSTDGTTLSHATVAEYLRDTHAAAARAGAVDIGLLTVDERPVAFVYGYHYQGRVYALRKGFDPAFAELRPGTVLTKLLLEDSFARGDCLYDMGVGSLEIKRHWQTRLATSYRYTHFPLSAPRAQLLRMKRWWLMKVHGPGHVACA